MLQALTTLMIIGGFALSAPEGGSQDLMEKYGVANSLLDADPDSSLVIFKEILPLFQLEGDTVRMIRCHIGISDVYKNRGQFGYAYDHIWDALFLADELQDSLLLLEVHEDVGGLYGILNKFDEAFNHFRIAMNLADGLIISGDLKESRLVNLHYSMAIIHRREGRFLLAMTHIDSCLLLRDRLGLGTANSGYLDAELGRNYLHLNQIGLAEKYLQKANAFFKDRELHYEIMTSLYLGDLYAERSIWGLAEQYYTICLELISRYNSHTDVSREALHNLSLAQDKQGKKEAAFVNLERAYSIGDSLYHSRSSQNSDLFQINNKYEEELRDKDRQILEQESEISRHRLARTRLRMSLAIILFIIIAAAFILRYRSRVRNIKLEKEQLKQEAERDLEKARAVSEAKNRELTASALQMIEKERFIEDLLEELKTSSNTAHDTMAAKVKLSNRDRWQQFNVRFTEVNSEFYHKLLAKHPDLSPTEQKHCALIKLNFSSKEMADLLNISVSSVHISRHRIRKKFGLERDDNLSNYIAAIT